MAGNNTTNNTSDNHTVLPEEKGAQSTAKVAESETHLPGNNTPENGEKGVRPPFWKRLAARVGKMARICKSLLAGGAQALKDFWGKLLGKIFFLLFAGCFVFLALAMEGKPTEHLGGFFIFSSVVAAAFASAAVVGLALLSMFFAWLFDAATRQIAIGVTYCIGLLTDSVGRELFSVIFTLIPLGEMHADVAEVLKFFEKERIEVVELHFSGKGEHPEVSQSVQIHPPFPTITVTLPLLSRHDEGESADKVGAIPFEKFPEYPPATFATITLSSPAPALRCCFTKSGDGKHDIRVCWDSSGMEKDPALREEFCGTSVRSTAYVLSPCSTCD